MGKVNKTKLGLDCQSWNAQIPHNHDRPPDVFPQIRYGENYCRNAGGDEPMPWCFTMDPHIRWQYCDIPICGRHLIHGMTHKDRNIIYIYNHNNIIYTHCNFFLLLMQII